MTPQERAAARLRLMLAAHKSQLPPSDNACIQHGASSDRMAQLRVMAAASKQKRVSDRRRPSDGMPVGSKEFNYEEYLTRLSDRKAADPETFSREKAAKRRATNAYWENINHERALEAANKGLAGELTCDPKERHRKIWRAAKDAEQAEYVNRVYLRQTDRIFNVKHAPRVRGVGAAARRAGF